MIEVSHLTKSFGVNTVVDDLSFTVRDGQTAGFLGPNGAGKSTTIAMLTGTLAPGGGRIRIGGTDLLDEPEKAKRNIGYLPEYPPLYEDMTVREYLRFAASLRKVPANERKGETDRVMELLSLTGVRDKLLRNLSKGLRQRCGFAQALVGDPGVLILDEPASGLDPEQIRNLRELLKTLKGDHTILVSSHNLAEISEICDTLLIIREGREVASGTPDEILRQNGEEELMEQIRAAKDGAAKAALRQSGLERVFLTLVGGAS